MRPKSHQLESACSLFLLILQTAVQSAAASQFTSHISVNTPTRSFTHGVGNLVGQTRRTYQRRKYQGGRSISPPSAANSIHGGAGPGGYPRHKPSVPFTREEIVPRKSMTVAPWQYNGYMMAEVPIAVLPPSPYKVDSADPESLWPEGLFLPPLSSAHFGTQQHTSRRSDNKPGEVLSDSMDPYLLEGTEAIAAVEKASAHGLYFFDDIPHIESLLANQELRTQNNLKPHRIASIRHTWPYNRP